MRDVSSAITSDDAIEEYHAAEKWWYMCGITVNADPDNLERMVVIKAFIAVRMLGPAAVKPSVKKHK